MRIGTGVLVAAYRLERGLHANTRGVVMSEYLVVFVLLSLPLSAALIFALKRLTELMSWQQMLLSLPAPMF